MAGAKLPPRQKMIGMMYLVLTALLAMNVSKDILNAFVTVNDGLEKTKHNFKEKNQAQYKNFQESYQENPKKYEDEYKEAMQVKKVSDEVVDYIDEIKIEIIAGIEPTIPKEEIKGKNEFGEDTLLNLMNVKVKDNYIFSTNLLVGSEPANPKTDPYSAMELKGKLEAFRDQLKTLVPSGSAIDVSLDETFVFEEKENASGVVENWPAYNFYGVPAAATLTLLTKMQTDVRNAESDVIKYLLTKVDAATYKFTNLAPAVIPQSNYVLEGDSFKAMVFLAAFDTTMSPTIFLGDDYKDTVDYEVTGDTVGVDVDKGRGYINIPARSAGDYTYKGVINFKGPSGLIEHYPYAIDYKVAKPSVTISPTAMNVFYLGLDNPVSISAAGVASDKLRPSINNGSITKGKDGWVVKVSKAGTATVSVSAEKDGKSERMGSMEFRVKKIPTPIAKISAKNGGAVRKVVLGAASRIQADLENFDFEVTATVVSYDFVYMNRGNLVTNSYSGFRLDPAVKRVIQSSRPGDKIFFENIKAKLPDGTTRVLPTLSFKLI